MRAPLILAFAGFAGVAVATAAVAQDYKLPARRPGYWESSATMDIGGRSRTIVTQMCTDAATEKVYSVVGQNAGRNCSQREIHPIPGGFAFNSTCAFNGSTSVSSGTMTGDFQSHFHMEMTSHRTPGGESHTTIDGKWVGECPAGRVPGDMVMPGGMVMNMNTGAMAHQ